MNDSNTIKLIWWIIVLVSITNSILASYNLFTAMGILSTCTLFIIFTIICIPTYPKPTQSTPPTQSHEQNIEIDFMTVEEQFRKAANGDPQARAYMDQWFKDKTNHSLQAHKEQS